MTYIKKIMCNMGMVAKNRLYFAKLTENRQGVQDVPIAWAFAVNNT